MSDTFALNQYLSNALLCPVVCVPNTNKLHLITPKRPLSAGEARFSVHEMFIEAGPSFWPHLAVALRSMHARRKIPAKTRIAILNFIGAYQAPVAASQDLGTSRGAYYDLKQIFSEHCKEYDLHLPHVRIRWSSRLRGNTATRVTYGIYDRDQAIIEINSMLDDEAFPYYFVAFVVYHEMMHALVPASCDARGRLRQHCQRFVAEEKKFHYYKQAKAWERSNRASIFEMRLADCRRAG